MKSEFVWPIPIARREDGIAVVLFESPETLPADYKDQLLSQLVYVTQDGFAKSKREESIRRHALGGDKLFLALERGKSPVGYLSSRDMRADPFLMVYIQAIVTLRNVQGIGIGSLLVGQLIQSGRYSHIAAQTQNPVVYVLLAKVSGEIYPQPDIVLPADITLVGRILSKECKISVDETTLIVRNAYGDGMLTGFEPQYKGSHPAGKLFDQLPINAARGDAVLVIGRL